MLKTINIISLGCSKNLVDSEDLASRLRKKYNVVFDSDQKSEIVVVNTCGFILDAQEESINTILEFAQKKKNGEIEKLFVFGCLSQRFKKDLINEIPEADEYFGVNSLNQMLEVLDAEKIDNLQEPRMISPAAHMAYIKVSEGCNRKCSFCSIPYIRGGYTSRTIESIENEVALLAQNGVKEFNLIAQDLSWYGKDLYKEFKLASLMEHLVKIEGVHWLRMHYTYPNNFPLETLDIMKSNRNVCNYLDIPIQHINNKILQNMHRGHTKEETLELLDKFRSAVPDIALRTTLLVGFPGETDKVFEELVDFVKSARFDRLGVFAYSPEQGTFSAENFKDSISQKRKDERVATIMEIQQEISAQLNNAKIGKTFEMIVDKKEGEYFVGRTQYDSPDVDNEVLVLQKDAPDFKVGNFYNVKVFDSAEFDLFARPLNKNEQNE